VGKRRSRGGAIVKVQAGTSQPFEVARGLAEILIAEGKVHAYSEPVAKKIPDAKFGLNRDQYDGEPYITATCTGCDNRTRFTGPTAHKTQVFRHCGVTDRIPQDIAEQYERARQNWKPKRAAQSPTPMNGFVIPI
jgi:hypothetical protein